MPYNCMFHKDILNGFEVTAPTRGHKPHSIELTKVHNYVTTESGVTVLFLCTPSDHALYLYKVSFRYRADTTTLYEINKGA